ncbi:MAG: pyridoxal phosphate-dependent aminotransferase [Acidobacteria bacterium]|nr:pyridoxal phosphate-dependent aminotransferase [Acidobacteriota bacterium]
MFSARVPRDLSVNRLSAAAAALRARGAAIVDLTESNPTRAGFVYPPDLLAPLGDPRGLRYEPHPCGLAAARAAISAEYARRDLPVSPDRIVLTASTSEAYGLIFKLLADPGDDVLVPRPSYPLFEHLTRFDALNARTYDLEHHGAWRIDMAGLERAWSPRTRAVLLVSPNNPTGSFVTQAELDRLAALCADRGAALVVDEVFADYVLDAGAAAAAGRVLERSDVLAFALGGLSKSAGLPQVKLGWIAIGGPAGAARAAIERLEFLADGYLSVSTPVQAAAADLLASGAAVRAQIARRVGDNHHRLLARAARVPACRVLRVEGGWSAVLRVPALAAEEDLVLDLLERDRVLAHPGYFFDFPHECYLVVSLLTAEPAFAAGVDRILRRFERLETT